MPNCFQLIDKTTKVPAKLAKIDDELCQYLNVEPHPVKYYQSWYDALGLGFACGRTYDELREIYKEDVEYLRILDYLEERYDVDAWYSCC